MTTDLRAALCDDRAALAWLARDLRRTFHDMHDADDDVKAAHAKAVAAVDRLVALADAPPTVAELLAALRSPSLHGRQFVEWQSADDGDRMRARRSGARGFVVENSIDGAIWHRSSLTHSDLTQPATLVEVTP